MRFPFIEIGGPPRERGRQFGERTTDLIRLNLDNYWRLFRDLAGLDRASVIDRSALYYDPIKDYAPDLFEEIQGIAEGSNIPVAEIVALNCRTEFLSAANVPFFDECTAIFCGPETTANGSTLLAQNWDWAEICRGGMVLLQIDQPGLPTVLTLTEAGMVGKIGLNSAGVGVCTNFVLHNHRRRGVPFHLILREALNAPRLGVAVAAVYRPQRADSGNYLFGHAAGEGINLEATPDTVAFQHPSQGLLVHTNHFLAPRLQAGDHGILESDNTLLRYARARRLLEAQIGRITIDTLKEILQDHFNAPRSICRHSDRTLPEVERNVTLASIIIDLTTGTAYIARDEPCDSVYYSVQLGNPKQP
jgi:isopenicillin-N N-acyltransferase-like protein